MNKKGQEILGFLTWFAVLVAVAVFLQYRSFQAPAPDFIGSKQLQLLTASKEADKAQLYLEQSVKIVTPNSIKDLAESGSGCGNYLGFSVWSNRTATCIPNENDLKLKYKELFDARLDSYLSKYNLVAFPKSNYTLNFKQSKNLKIIGISQNSLIIPFAGAATYTAEQIDDFFKSNTAHPNSPLEGLGPCLVQAELRTGIPSIVLMGITILESGWGESGLAGPNCPFGGPSYNLFSVKGSQRSPGTAGICEWETHECLTQKEEQNFGERIIQCNPNPTACETGKNDCLVKDNFKAYSSKCDSVNDAVRLLQTSHYWEGKGESYLPNCKPIKEVLNNPVEVVTRIGGCGYATGAGWADNVVKVMDTITRNAGKGESAGSGGVYIVKPNFKTEINYSFNEYEAIKSNLTRMSADIKNNCLTGTQDSCINNILSQEAYKKHFSWSLECGNEEQKVFTNLLDAFTICSESNSEGVCLFSIPDAKASFSLKDDKLGNRILALSSKLNTTLNQEHPAITDSFSQEGRGVLTTCDEISFNIQNQRAVISAKNCAGKGDLQYIYDKQLPLVKIISPAGKRFVMFPNPSSYNNIKSKLNTIPLTKHQIRLCAESKYTRILIPISTDQATEQANLREVALPVCSRGDISKLSQTKLKDCAAYHDIFSNILTKISLPFDPLLIDAQAYQETLCNPYANAGGILQSDALCLFPTPSSTRYDPSKSDQWACPTVDIQAEKSLLELARYYESFKDMSPTDSVTLTLFAYNRFIEVAKKARAYYESGTPLYDAMKKACLEEYGTEATSKNAPGGRTWNEYFKALKAAGNQNVAPYEISDDYYCGTISGPSYPTRIIKNFEDTCRQIGGTVEIKKFGVGTQQTRPISPIQINYEPYIYKIAFFAGDVVPPTQAQGFSVEDTPLAEKNITISFPASTESDIDHYNVYYSESEFTDINETGVVKLAKEIQNTNAVSYKVTFKVPEEDKNYWFAVVAVDKSGNFNPKATPVVGHSTDDLKPGPIQSIEFERIQGVLRPALTISINPPQTNEDGSQLKDLRTYTLYLRERISCTSTDIPIVLADPQAVYENLEFDNSSIPHKTKPETPVVLPLDYKSKTYCLVGIAEDSTREFAVKSTRYSANSGVFIDGSKI